MQGRAEVSDDAKVRERMFLVFFSFLCAFFGCRVRDYRIEDENGAFYISIDKASGGLGGSAGEESARVEGRRLARAKIGGGWFSFCFPFAGVLV